MNKLLTKIAASVLGLSMAIGVGVATGSQQGAKKVNASPTTATITGSASGITQNDEPQSITADGVSFGGVFKQYSTTALWFTSSSGFIYNTVDLGNIISISIAYKTGGSPSAKQFLSVGTSVISSYQSGTPQITTSNGNTTGTFNSSNVSSLNTGKGFFNLSISNKNLQATSITVTYEESSGGDTDATIDSFTVTAPSAYTRTDPIALSDWTITPVLSDESTPSSIASYLTASPALSTQTTGSFNVAFTYDAVNGPYEMSEGVSNVINSSYTVNPIPDSALEFNASTYKIGKGNEKALDLKDEIKAQTGDSTIVYTVKSGNQYISLSNGVVTGVANGDAVVTATKGSLSVDITIQVRNITIFTDTIDLDLTQRPASDTYGEWSGKQASDSKHSDAVYAGQSAGEHSAIQLRSNNSNSGIVSTGTGGNLKSVTINFNSNTAATRTVSIYGSTSAYTQATNLYAANTQGTKIDDVNIDDGASQKIDVSGSYQYVGIRSKSGALYLDSVVVEWEQEEIEKTVSEITVSTNPTKTTYAVGETLSLNGIVVTASFEQDIDDVQTTDYIASPAEGYKFTAADATAGSKTITITYNGSLPTVDDETISTSFSVTVTPAIPVNITRTSSANWTDTQTLAEGTGRWKVTYSDDSTVTNIKIGDANTVLKIDDEVVDPSELAKNYNGKQGKIEYTDQNVTLSNTFSIPVAFELSVDSFEDAPENYILVGDTSELIKANFTSLNGEPDSYSVVSSNPAKLSVSFDDSLVEYDSTEKTGFLYFSVTAGATQGQYTVTVSVTKGQRTESKTLPILVRGEAPAETGVQYRRITSVDEVTTGKYVIATGVSGTYYALGSISSGQISSTTVTVTEDVISEESAGLLPLDITRSENTVAVSKSGTYLTMSTSTSFGTSSSATYYSIALAGSGKGGTFKIYNSTATVRALIYRTGTTNKFAPYAQSNLNGTEYFAIELFKQESASSATKEGFDYVKEFVDGYMYMDTISTSDKGSGSCKGENGYYLTAKRAWNTMITTYNSKVEEEDRENLQSIFQNSFEDAYARYMSWASACGDSAPFVGTTIANARATSMFSDGNSAIMVVTLVSLISISAFGAFIFLRKRKEQ